MINMILTLDIDADTFTTRFAYDAADNEIVMSRR